MRYITQGVRKAVLGRAPADVCHVTAGLSPHPRNLRVTSDRLHFEREHVLMGLRAPWRSDETRPEVLVIVVTSFVVVLGWGQTSVSVGFFTQCP